MPRRDGTGPAGQGPGSGRGMGRGAGRGMGRGAGQGMGRMGGSRPGAGPAGYCVCTACGERVAHQRGIPCYSLQCPKCGKPMVRE